MNFDIEEKFGEIVVGIDEVGRGTCTLVGKYTSAPARKTEAGPHSTRSNAHGFHSRTRVFAPAKREHRDDTRLKNRTSNYNYTVEDAHKGNDAHTRTKRT